MEFPPFLLDQWLSSYQFNKPPVRYNLASSTGPHWTLAELQDLPKGRLDLAQIPIAYAPPEGSIGLREAIANLHGVDPEWVIVTTGASEALSILYSLSTRPGAAIVLPSPGYPAFSPLAEANGLRTTTYSLQRSNGYQPNVGEISGVCDHSTVLALVNNPHNPTGSTIPRSDIDSLAEMLGSRGIPLIVDEVYHPLYHDGGQPSAAGIANVIVIGDMSKSMSLPGLRIGWIIDADPGRRARIVNARSYLSISGSPITEAIATQALLNSDAVLGRLRVVCAENLAILEQVMSDTSHILSWVRPNGGTTAFPWFVDGRNCRGFCEQLAEAGVLVAPGDCFGAPEHMRVGFGELTDGFEEAAGIFRDALLAIQLDEPVE